MEKKDGNNEIYTGEKAIPYVTNELEATLFIDDIRHKKHWSQLTTMMATVKITNSYDTRT